MTDTTDIAQPGAVSPEGAAPRRAPLSQLRLGQLQELADSLGVAGTGKMRKSDLLEAIRAKQGGTARRRRAATAEQGPPAEQPSAQTAPEPQVPEASPATDHVPAAREPRDERPRRERGARQDREQAPSAAALLADAVPARDAGAARPAEGDGSAPEARTDEPRPDRDDARGEDRARLDARAQLEQSLDQRERARSRRGRGRDGDADGGSENGAERNGADRNGSDRNGTDRAGTDRNADRNGADRNADRERDGAGDRSPRQRDDRGPRPVEDDDEGGRRGRRGRYRDRKRRGRGEQQPSTGDAEPQVSDDDVLVPVAGILDVLDSYAFVRTSGYLPGPNDVYVSLGQVKKHGLRKGDAVTGAVRAPRDGEQPETEAPSGGGRGGRGRRDQQKYNPLVRVDTVNGMTPDEARRRADFSKLTPLYPQSRLRMETDRGQYTQRVIDLVAPIGKGQRGLIVAPPKAGKTIVMQQIANAITRNNPDVHLMVVLVDERPEEVTDMQRTVKGEVIASTFDRPADDHTTVAELAIERAKRLVELGHDVVVLLDSLTRLSRAYNTSAPASGRILSGGIDASALYPPKRFFGAARNIENGGSLTILASALVETGSKADEVIFEEFKGTGNMELRLSRSLADKRIFPAVDVNASGTRREEILMSGEELKVVYKLRRVLGALDSTQAIELVLGKLRETGSNAEFLMQVQRTSPGGSGQTSELLG